MEYCEICGGTGILLDGTPCECGRYTKDEGITCLSIPEAYRGNTFNPELLPLDRMNIFYKEYMEELYQKITTMRLRNKNIFLCSPMKTGKTVLAYACTEYLFKRNIATFPYFDILELASIMKAVDIGKDPILINSDEVEPLNVYLAPYLFVKMTSEINYQVIETIIKLVDRRTRRGNVTIILSHLSWSQIVERDPTKLFKTLGGNGSFGTLENKTFWEG